MRRIKRYQVAAYSCLVIKYEHDKRYSEDGVSTHDRYFFMLTFLLKINCIFFQFCYTNIILNFSWARIWECLSIHLCVFLKYFEKLFGAIWRLQKWSNLAEILHTCSLGEYLGFIFRFSKKLNFGAWGRVFANTRLNLCVSMSSSSSSCRTLCSKSKFNVLLSNAIIGPSNNSKLLKLSLRLRFARLTMYIFKNKITRSFILITKWRVEKLC